MKRLPIRTPSVADIFHTAQQEEVTPTTSFEALPEDMPQEDIQTPGTVETDVSANYSTIDQILKNYSKLDQLVKSNMEMWLRVRDDKNTDGLLHNPQDPDFDWERQLKETEDLVNKASELSLVLLADQGENYAV